MGCVISSGCGLWWVAKSSVILNVHLTLINWREVDPVSFFFSFFFFTQVLGWAFVWLCKKKKNMAQVKMIKKATRASKSTQVLTLYFVTFNCMTINISLTHSPYPIYYVLICEFLKMRSMEGLFKWKPVKIHKYTPATTLKHSDIF